MTDFDPDTFMTQTVDGPLETEYKLVPASEYQGVMIDDFDSKALELKEGNAKASGKPYSFLKLSLPFVISNDPKVMAETGRDKAIVYKELNVDRDENGAIAQGPNKNVELDRIYDAAGLTGVRSIGQLRSTGPFVITVVHESGKRDDGSEWKRAKVGKVTRQA